MNFIPKGNLALPVSLRSALKERYGEVIQTEDVAKLERVRICAVGDVTVASFIKMGRTPDLSIFDRKTLRKEKVARLDDYIERIDVVKSPPGVISLELWHAIEKAIGSPTKRGIRVIGEEDLASLPCIYLSKNGSICAYGIPHEGICVIRVEDKIKKRVERLLRSMDEK